MKGKKRRTGTHSLNTETHKEGEEGELLCIVMPYPIRYCTYAVPTDRQQLQQYQQQTREKRKVYQYYNHSYHSHRTTHNSSHPAYLFVLPDQVLYTRCNPWQGNSYSNCNNRERKGRNSGISIIRMVLIGQYIIHLTRHTVLIAASSRMVAPGGMQY